MVKNEKEKIVKKEKAHGFMEIVKSGLGFVSQIISASILPPITEGADMIIDNVEERIMIIEKRIMKKMSALLIIGFGMIFLIFALFFFLKEFLGWSNSLAFFSIGIIFFIIGLLLKIGESDR